MSIKSSEEFICIGGDCTINHKWQINFNNWSDKCYMVFRWICLGDKIDGLKSFTTFKEAQEAVDRLNNG